MPDLVRYQPALPAPIASGSVLRNLILELLLSVVLPEVGVPVLMANVLGALTQPIQLAAYFSIVANFTQIVANLLEIIRGAKEIGWAGNATGDSLQEIARALYYDYDNEKIPIADYLKDVARYTPSSGDNEGESIGLAQSLYNCYTTLYFRLSDGTYIPFTDALTRLTLSGVTRNYQTIPL